MKLGIITNPLSQRNKRKGGRLDSHLAADPDVIHERLDSIADIPSILKSFAQREVGVIVLDGGDGTIQAALSEIFNGRMFEQIPPLAVVSSGMTNAVAADVGLRGPPNRAIARLIASAREGSLEKECVERNVIRVSHTQGGDPVYGMLFAVGAVYRAIGLCRRAIHPLGVTSSAAVGVTLASMVVRQMLLGGRRDEIFRGDRIAVDWNGAERQSGDLLFVLASTLHRFPLGIRPFWGKEGGGLRVTHAAFPARRFARSVLPILYGRTRRKLDADSYLSRNVDRVSFDMTCPFVLDGELYEPAPGVPVTLEASTRVRFVR